MNWEVHTSAHNRGKYVEFYAKIQHIPAFPFSWEAPSFAFLTIMPEECISSELASKPEVLIEHYTKS